MKTNYLFMKSGVFAAFFFIFAIQLNAQQNYKLSEYVNPNYFYHSLGFTANLNANGNLTYSKLDNSSWFKNNTSSFGGNFGISYYQIKNTARYQGTQNVRIYYNGGLSKTFSSDHYSPADNSTSTQKYNNFNTEFDYSSTNRFYNSRKQFLEIVPEIVLGFQGFRHTSDYNPITYPFNSKNLTKSNNVSFGLSFMVGTDRIENVENARLAIYILNDLQKSGDVKKDLSNAQVDQLARFITKLRNKRFFDSRIRNIASVTSIDSLLTSMGIREHSGASYFMILNDDWNYANGPIRQSGHRFAFGVTPGYSNNHVKMTRDDILNSSSPSSSQTISTNKAQLSTFDIGAYYYLEKPVNLTWQHSTIVSLGYELEKQVNNNSTDPVQSSDYKTTVYDPNLHLSLERIYGYYPSSRTNLALDFKISGLYSMENQKDTTEMKNNQLKLSASVFLKGNYYFSPQLRLNLNAGVSDNYQHLDNNIGTSMHVMNRTNSWYPSIGLSLSYNIF